MSQKWIYREDSGFVMFICFLVVLMFLSIPFLVFILHEQTRYDFFNKSLKEIAYTLLFLGTYFALFLAFANAIYQNNVRNWIKSFIRPDYLEISEEGLHYQYQDEEVWIEWQQISGVKPKDYDKLIFLLDNGDKQIIYMSGFAKPFDQVKYFILCFIMPVAGVINPWLGLLSFLIAVIISSNYDDNDVSNRIKHEINHYRRQAFLGHDHT
ncbi:hypothetical protein [Alysiella crassa]|uniref:Uncharacterized protein n=1 Tax=Alysiella crassa TaxID=153491 RepID=A0A376BKF1_9NEIS|nr:hypothetical protein [Alysiella crassa]UOP07620.1 hypothetical protein LVJ80_04385 [Alysiella crassa]SSY70156.1 Uncharacterised protein [Alysiella crassa]